MKTILFVILAIIQVVIALLPSLGKLYREENGPFSYKTTVWGKLLHIACILGLLFTIGLYLYTQEEEENSRKSLTMGLSQRDSLHRIHLDSIQNNTIELLAKYGYKVDSSNNQIIKAIDISKVNIESPLIEVCKDGIKGLHKTNDSLYFNLSLCNKKMISQHTI